jgi:hypothetical protein
MKSIGLCLAGLALGLTASGAQAQLAISANDGKQPRLGQKPSDVKPDNVTVIDLNSYPPRLIGKVEELRDRHQRPEVRPGGQQQVHSRRYRLGH